MALAKRQLSRLRRQTRVRRRTRGQAQRPRLCVFRSNRYIYVQVISDETGTTLASASSFAADLRDGLKSGATREAAKRVGARIAALCRERGIDAVVFDRNGFLYHGRVKALADAAREAGLQF